MSDWLQGDSLPDVGAPLVGDGGQFSAGTPAVNNAAAVASKVAYGMGTQAATLPQRAIQNSQFSLDTGNYDPSAPLEAAMLPMGAGAVAGVPVRGGEAVFGSGAVRTIRDVGRDIGHESLPELNKPGHFYRGMSEAEYNNTIGAGKDLKSNESGSIPGEGTNFSDDIRDAESYANFGRTDPRKTGSPNYLVEIKPEPGELTQWRDGYYKAPSVSRDRVTSVLKMEPKDGAIVGTPVKLAAAAGGTAAFLQGSNDPAKAEEAPQKPFDMNGYLSGIRQGESGNNYQSAASGTSSASGAYQFIGSTWQQFKPPGAPNDPSAATPAQQDQAAAAFTTRNAKVLQGAGIAPDPLTLSIAHQQGASVAVAFSKAPPDALAKDFAPPAGVAGNRAFFFNKDGTPMTVAQSKAKYADFYQAGGGGAPAAPAAPAAKAPSKLQQVADFLHGTNAPPSQEQKQQQPATQQEPEPLPFEAPFSPASPVSTAGRGKGGKVYLQRYGRTYDDTGKQVG